MLESSESILQERPTGDGRLVPALVQAKRILDFLSASPDTGTISDIARHLGLPKSSVHRICRTLLDLRLLSEEAGGAFRIGPGVLRWSGAFNAQSSLTAEFQKLSVNAAAIGGGALNLSVLSGDSVVYMACRPGISPLGMSFRVGMSLPAVFTATGKAMLSTWQEEELEVLARNWPEPVTRRSVRSLGALKEELAEARRRGFSIEDGQLREGMLCLGVPIFGQNASRAEAGLAVGFLSIEAKDKIEHYGSELTRLGRALSLRIGAAA